MGKHSAPGNPPAPTEVTLERAAAVLASLGFEVTSTTDQIDQVDRLVVGAHGFSSVLWMHHERPLMLVVDTTERIPTDFSHATALAKFINTWNHDRLGPVASYRLNDAGDFRVATRRGIRATHGLTDDQLAGELADAFEHAALFSTRLRERFLDARLDQPLPQQLMRAQDAELLLGRHPSSRHMARGATRDVTQAPELFDDSGGPADTALRPVDTTALTRTLEAVEFVYAVDHGKDGDSGNDSVVATGVNGVPFALTVDGDPNIAHYARVTAMWNTGLDAGDEFLSTWLLCNDVNERSSSTSAYLHEYEGTLHLHAESTLWAGAGASRQQLGQFVVSSLVSGLATVDHLSRQVQGHSAVQWPPRD